MDDCIFCKIIAKEIPTDIIFENKDFLAFRDINPQAPVHILVIPKKHYKNLDELDSSLMQPMLQAVQEIVKQEKIAAYRLVFNKGEIAGQSVFHIHGHILSGRPLGWPPG